MLSPPLDATSTELSHAFRASRTLLAHSLQHNHGTPCMHLLAFHIFSSSSAPRYLSLDALYVLAECENGQIPGMCTLAAVFRDGIPGIIPASLPRAAALWRKAVIAYGCALSSYLLACAAEAGAGVQRRPALAAVLYESALLAEGFGFAAARLARLLEDGAEGVEKDLARAVRLYEFAVRKGSTDAIARLARILKDGRVAVVPKGMAGAVQLLDQAAREGNSGQAMTTLAAMLEDGAHGVGCDPVRALALYERAVEQEEDVSAMLHLARMLIDGRVEKDALRAVETLEKAVDLGSRAAVWKLAGILLGDDDVRDETRAFNLLLELVDEEQYSTRAKMELAWLLSGNSHEVPMDAVRAAELYEEVLAEVEEPDPIVNLADLLLDGCGELPADSLRAVVLYERAAVVHDNVLAMNRLGHIYSGEVDRGVPMDLETSIRWYERAADHGFVEAKYNLARMLTISPDGKTEPVDLPRGMKLYEDMIDEYDHMWAMTNLSRCLLPDDEDDAKGNDDDEEEAQQIARAMEILERVIRIGLQNSEGELRPLGIAPEAGFCLKQDDISERLRERAMCRGAHIVAMVNLAELEVLRSEPKKIYKALSLLERALADFEAPDAFDIVAFNFQTLREVNQEANGDVGVYKRVARICQLFIERTGLTEPMCVLAEMLVEGMGVRRSAEDAARVYDKAICMGDRRAMLALAELLSSGAPGLKGDRRQAFDLLTRVVAEGAHGGSLARAAVVDLAVLCSRENRRRPGVKS